jgi:hypothetical protein
MMSFSKQFQQGIGLFRSVDFWLFGITFISSVFMLQNLGSVPRQLTLFGAILAAGIVISIIVKRKRNWRRKETGWKGMLYAIATLLLVTYAVCSSSIYLATLRGIELEGSFLARAIAALPTFGGLLSFMYLGIFAAAANLGLTDLPDFDDR